MSNPGELRRAPSLAVEANPIYSYLMVFRGLAYEGSAAPLWNRAVMATTALGFLALGTYTFAQRWRTTAAPL